MTLAGFNRLAPDEARRALERCCGSRRWVERMVARRPFVTRRALVAVAQRIWGTLAADDWREAFAHHPRIGDLASLRERYGATADLAAREQGAVAAAAPGVLEALAEGNRAYEERFGYIFIVCATGRGAEEMLHLLRQRLANDAETELGIAAGEQMRITRLRLDRMVREG